MSAYPNYAPQKRAIKRVLNEGYKKPKKLIYLLTGPELSLHDYHESIVLPINYDIPICQSKPLRLAFLKIDILQDNFNQSYYSHKNPGLDNSSDSALFLCTSFDPTFEINNSELLQDFSTILAKLRDIVNLVEANQNYQSLLEEIRKKSRYLIQHMYNKLCAAFQKLKIIRNRLSSNQADHIEQDIELVQCLIIFYICRYLCVKTDTHSNFRNAFLLQLSGLNINLILNVSNFNSALRILVLEFIIKAFYFEEQFTDQFYLLEFLNIVHLRSLDKLENVVNPAKFNELKLIMHSENVKNLMNVPNEHYADFVNEVLSNVYLIMLPQYFSSFITFSRVIFISNEVSSSACLESKAYWGFAIITVIHEAALYAIKLANSTDFEWITTSTLSKNAHPGILVDDQLYGKDLDHITRKASDFLSNTKNWTLSYRFFRNQVKKLNVLKSFSDLNDLDKAVKLNFKHTDDLDKVISIGKCFRSLRRTASKQDISFE